MATLLTDRQISRLQRQRGQADVGTARLLSIGETWTVTRDAAATGDDDGIFGPGDSATVTPPTTHTITASVFQAKPPTLVIASGQQYTPDPVWRLVALPGTDVEAGDTITNGAATFEVQDIEQAIQALHAALRVVPPPAVQP